MIFSYQTGDAADKIIDGFTGTDTLSINYSGISGVGDFVITKSGDYKVLTDSNGNTISFKNIETLTIAGVTYVDIYQGRDSSGGGTVNNAPYSDPVNFKPCRAGSSFSCLGSYNNNSISSAMYSSNDALVFLYPFADTSGSNFTIPSLAQSFGYDGSSALTITGTAYNDTVSDRDSDINPGGYSISTYAGIDVIDIDNSKAADTVDAGSDNDFVFVTTASGKSFTSDTAIKGGSGSDWLIIDSGYSGSTKASISYTINSSPTLGFENVLVSTGDDTLTGDALDNILLGSGGADTINGLAGNDSLYGFSLISGCYFDGSSDGSDKLYGGDGDDLLVGGAGDDLFDGGIGQDTLTGDGGIVSCGYEASQTQGGASGSDTFVIRAGDGGSSISDADIITDFTDGTDIIGMSGLNYSDLTIEQGTGSYSSHVVIKKTSSGEFLTIIQNTNISQVDDNDFSAI